MTDRWEDTFYEAAIDEVECGWGPGCRREATTRLEWDDGWATVLCDEHVIEARMGWQSSIVRLSTWVPVVA